MCLYVCILLMLGSIFSIRFEAVYGAFIAIFFGMLSIYPYSLFIVTFQIFSANYAISLRRLFCCPNIKIFSILCYLLAIYNLEWVFFNAFWEDIFELRELLEITSPLLCISIFSCQKIFRKRDIVIE